MGRNFRTGLIVAILIVIGILVFRGCHSSSPSLAPSDPATESPPNEQEELAEPLPTSTPVEAATPPPLATPSTSEDLDRDALARKFASEMRDLQTCFSLTGTTEDSVEPTAENLDNVVRQEMGEVVAKNLDWTSSYIETPSGERRMIRTEVDYNGDESSARKLKYFSISNDGVLTAIPLGAEQQDPSEALIASLETEGKVTLRERNTRAYYANGGESNYLEKDGVLSDIEVSYNGKTFRCNRLQSPEGVCNCR